MSRNQVLTLLGLFAAGGLSVALLGVVGALLALLVCLVLGALVWVVFVV